MRLRFFLLVCFLTLTGCASNGQVARGTGAQVGAESVDVPIVFLPAELLDWEQWDEDTLKAAGWNVYFVEEQPVGEAEQVMARRPLRRGGRGRLGERTPPPLLNPRPTQEEIAARRRQTEEHRLIQQARERYDQALAEARARYPNHQGYQEHHFIPIYLGGSRTGPTYRLQSAYHQTITQEFRRQWGYGQGQPRPERLQQIILEVYSRYPIPQLIGISP